MSRKDAKDVEREYYEYRRRMQERRRQQSAGATARQAVSPVQRKPLKPEAPAPVESAKAEAAQPVVEEIRQPQPDLTVEAAAEVAAEVTDSAAEAAAAAGLVEEDQLELSEDAVDESALPAEDAPEEEEPKDADSDEDGEYEDEGEDEDEEDGEHTGFSGILRSVGARFGALGGLLKNIGKRRDDDEEEDEDDESDEDFAASEDEAEEIAEAESEAEEAVEVEPAVEAEEIADVEPAVEAEEPADVEPAAEVEAPTDVPEEAPAVDSPPEAEDAGEAADVPAEDADVPAEDAQAPVETAEIPVEDAEDIAAEDGVIRSPTVPIDLSVDTTGDAPEAPASAEDGEQSEDDEDDGEDEDEDDEDSGPSLLSGLVGKLKTLINRRREADDEDEEEDAAPPARKRGKAAGDIENEAHGANDMEGDLNTMDNNRKSMTEMMAEGMTETPSLSRRERRMLAEAAGNAASTANSLKEKAEDDLDQISEAIAEDEQPTVEYKPVRAKAERKKPVVLLDDEDEDEDEDDEEEEVETKKGKKARRPEKKREVYDDDEDEDDEDDEDYDDDDDDDYDDDEDEDDEISVGKRIFGFLKALIAIFLLLALIVLALRVGESAGYVKLDWIRDKVGSRIGFVNTLFPEPDASPARIAQ